MGRFFVCTVVLSAMFAAPAAASDAPATPPYSWTGFYIGENGGYASKRLNAQGVPGDAAAALGVSPVTTSFSARGAAGGVTEGFNWRVGEKWVAGVEADFQLASIVGNGTAAVSNIVGLPFNFGTFTVDQKVQWFGTVRPRVGYLAADNLLLFATGGVAYGKVNETANLLLTSPGSVVAAAITGSAFLCANPPMVPFGGPTCFAGSQSRIAVGWTAGFGLEYAFYRDFSFKAEYLYVDLGNANFPAQAVTTIGGVGPSFLNVTTHPAFNLVRVGLNWALR